MLQNVALKNENDSKTQLEEAGRAAKRVGRQHFCANKVLKLDA